ncbi:centromere protein O [Protopterus annectens]|uniref:centromere protein O n=1 Tax=Protopterus annectens TaxID=7888 RepID=UPI001CFC1460|nr:centromere protein O [Protopterus annectens]
MLSHLEQLEAHARVLALEQKEKQAEQENLRKMRIKIQQLRARRDELKAKLNAYTLKPIEEIISIQGKDIQTGLQEEENNLSVLQVRVKNTEGILQAFHLTGICAKKIPRGVCISISTAFQGIYLEYYYLNVALRQPPVIMNHNIPVFIPLKELEKQHLASNLKQFLSILSQHLNAYACRRYQAEQLQSRFGARLFGPLEKNSLCNLLILNYNTKVEESHVQIKTQLIYSDITRWLPTDVKINVEDLSASVQEQIKIHQTMFLEKPAHKAFEALLIEEEESMIQHFRAAAE